MDKAKRLTIMLDIDLHRKLHVLQAKRISKEQVSVSFSKVVNDELRKVVK